MKLAGKTVVLTGAGNGIGRALAGEMVRGGARVIGCDISDEGLAGTREGLPADLQGQFEGHQLDVTDRDAIRALESSLDGPVDCLVNCAGILHRFARLPELDDAEIERVFAVNFFGTLHMNRAFLPRLLERPEAQLVNTGSMSSLAPLPGQSVYGASKAAIKLLTETLYTEYLGTSLQVTLVLPGAVATNISGNSGVEMPGRSEGDTRAGQVATPEDAARTIFAGIEAGDYRVLVDPMIVGIDAMVRKDPKEAAETIAQNFASLLEG